MKQTIIPMKTEMTENEEQTTVQRFYHTGGWGGCLQKGRVYWSFY